MKKIKRVPNTGSSRLAKTPAAEQRPRLAAHFSRLWQPNARLESTGLRPATKPRTRLGVLTTNKVLSDTLQKQLERWQLFSPCLGANMTVDDSTHGTWTGANGYIDADTKVLMPVGAKCYIYSITKTFAAVRILQLIERSAFSLDDPIASCLPELSLPSEITIRRLLNHTSGVPSYTDLPEYSPATREKTSQPWSYQQVLSLTCSGKFDFTPGTGWHYSNTGYMLLRRLIESVTKQSFSCNIEEGIVRPLELRNTYVAESIDRGSVIPGYCRYLNSDEVLENVTPRYHPEWCKTGLIVSTTDDVAKFYGHLFSGSLLAKSSLTEMTRWVSSNGNTEPFFRRPGYGLGLMIDPDWGHGGLFGHGGDGPGFNTWAMHLPDFQDRRLTLAVFSNTSMGGHPFYLVKDILRVLKDA